MRRLACLALGVSIASSGAAFAQDPGGGGQQVGIVEGLQQ